MPAPIAALAVPEGVAPWAWDSLGAKQERNQWVIPERDDRGTVIGWAVRRPDGSKSFKPGGHRGLTMKWPLETSAGSEPSDPVFIVEGQSDTAAGLTIGILAIGRPSASGGGEYLCAVLKDRHVCVIVENDEAGKLGGNRIAARLATECASVRVITPPQGLKDLRRWVIAGASRQDIEDALGAAAIVPLQDVVSVPVREILRACLSNVDTKLVETDKGTREISVYKPVTRFGAELRKTAGDWPRSAGGMMFAPRRGACAADPLPGMASVWMIARPEALGAWMHDIADVRWAGSDSMAQDEATGAARTPFTKAEYFEWQKTHAAMEYRGIAALPHVPEMANVYYCPTLLPDASGFRLREFLDHLNPESDIDRVLLLAAVVTPGWGGEPGTRPALALVASKRGSGKTATATAIADLLWGGAITVKGGEEWQKVIGRILGDGGLGTRCVLFDNVKGRQDCASLDAILTSRTIDGWRPHYGQFSRPNDLTYYLTANYPKLSDDMATRAVLIRIGKPKHETDFVGWAAAFLRQHRAHVLSDIYQLLGQPLPNQRPAHTDRWQAWNHEVLGRCAEWLNVSMDDIGSELAVRREDANDDAERAEAIAEAIADWVAQEGRIPAPGKPARITRDEMHLLLVSGKVIDERSLGIEPANTMVQNVSALPPLEGRLVRVNRRMRRQGHHVRGYWEWSTDPNESANAPDQEPEQTEEIPI